jgi:hypothetical protein
MFSGCGVARKGATLISRVRRSSVGCGVAQLIVRRLAVRQFRVRFSARHPKEVLLLSEKGQRSDEDTRRRPSANGSG